ncbi:glycosyltransferase family 2 protein [bacterium]|nr:glycosyltransferase family 2 protein [bacterium]
MPEASVILCTHNRSAMLARALAALRDQSLPPDAFEIVVVDDASTDDTPQVLAAAAEQMPDLVCLAHDENRGPAPSRNTGAARARTDKLLFTDDDCIPDRCWAERLATALDHHPAVIGAIGSPRDNYMKLCHNVAEFYPLMPGEPPGVKESIAGANMAYRRSFLDSLGGFDGSRRCAADMEFSLRARLRGHQFRFVPDAVVVHDPDRLTLRCILGYAATHAGATIHLRHRYWALLQTPWLLDSPTLLALASPLVALWVTARIYTRTPRLLRLLHTLPVVYASKIAWCWGAARSVRKARTRRGS